MLIDPKSPTPIFRQIANQLIQAINSGVYKPGEMLPSLRHFAVEIEVNPNTIQRAYEALEREGVVETRRGIGVFVLNSSRSQWSAFEKKLSLQFQQSIRQGIKEGLQPDKIRRLFESAMHEFLKGAAR